MKKTTKQAFGIGFLVLFLITLMFLFFNLKTTEIDNNWNIFGSVFGSVILMITLFSGIYFMIKGYK